MVATFTAFSRFVCLVLGLLLMACEAPQAPSAAAIATSAPKYTTTLTDEAPVAAASSAARDRAGDDFFARWLRAHGEHDVVTDARGVGVAGNRTRLREAPYGVTKHGDRGFVVETEFRVDLPGGGED